VLVARGVTMSAPVHQDDQAYAPVGWGYEQTKVGVLFARLRTQGGRHLFTVKKPLDNEMACLEHESEVTARAALLAMGFYPTIRIVKIRRTGTLGDLSLCVDEVEHVGAFLEVERLVAPHESGEAAQRHFDEFVRSWGVRVERTTDTYDSLIRAAQLAGG
jgi:adenylate cyclase class 2